MKNLFLSICCVILLQISTCANQKSISSYGGRDSQPSVITELFTEYANEHETIETLNDSYREINNEQNKTYAKWEVYDGLVHQYFSEVKSYVNQFDSSTKKALLHYFNTQEKSYEENVAKFNKAQKSSIKELAVLDQRIQMMQLLASSEQLSIFLKNDLPDIQQIHNYNKDIDKLINQVEAANTSLTDHPELVKSQK